MVVTLTVDAANPDEGMTLKEVEDALARARAIVGVSDDSSVRVRGVTWRGNIKALAVGLAGV